MFTTGNDLSELVFTLSLRLNCSIKQSIKKKLIGFMQVHEIESTKQETD